MIREICSIGKWVETRTEEWLLGTGGREKRGCCLIGGEFPFGVMTAFWNSIAMMANSAVNV